VPVFLHFALRRARRHRAYPPRRRAGRPHPRRCGWATD